jgi:hypothetical protein
MTTVEEALIAYIDALRAARSATRRPEERQFCLNRLAAAAEMFAFFRSGDQTALLRIVEDERRSFGWSYLSGAQGEAAERTFARFAATVGQSAGDAP